jgi:hypothetical protein
MGKILTYLKISEENQSRDVLDAERLLEGMQAIYAVSPSGSKKDNFAIPLAEMTKIFIEKVKGTSPKEEPKEEPKQEQDDTFKLGDMFYVGKEGTSKIYQVILVEGQNFTFVRGNDDGTIESYEGLYSTDEANTKLKDGKWVKISDGKQTPKEQDFPYQVDDRFYLPSLKANFKISKISGDNVGIRYEGGELLTLTKSSFLENIKIKTYIPLADTEFKIGDKYLNKTVKDTFTIIQVYTDFIDVKFTGGNEATYDILFGKEKIADGTWVKVLDEQKENPKEDEYEFKFVGDKFYNTERDENFVVSEVYKKTIVIEYEDGEREVFSRDTAKALIKDKYWVKVVDEEKEEPKNYKVGDKFLWAKENMTFTIDFIKNGELGIIYSDGLTGIMTTEQFEKGLSTGYYKPYTEEAKPEEKKTRKPRQPRTKSEQDKKIEHILDINLDEIQF